MSKNIVWIIFVLLIFPVKYPYAQNGKILYVGGEGEGNYTKIQDAINDAKDGYVIYVYPGYYNESLHINKSLTIIGANKQDTIIDGCGAYSAVYFLADKINFSGFTIKNSSVAIYLQSNGNNIYENIIENCDKALLMENADNNTIRDNIIRNINKSSFSWKYKFLSNNLSKNKGAFAFLQSRAFLKNFLSHNHLILPSYILSNFQPVINTICVLIKYSDNCNFIRNKFYECNGTAIYIKSSKNINVSRNEFNNLSYGIICDFVSFIKIWKNKFLGGDSALQFVASYDVTVIGNEIRNCFAFKNGSAIGMGIINFNSDTMKISGNSIHNINFAGIVIFNTNNVIISNNSITNISGEIVFNNTKGKISVGIALFFSSNGTIYENVIRDANNGVLIEFARNINIEKNKLENIDAYIIEGKDNSSSGIGITGFFVKNFNVKNNEIKKVNFCALFSSFSSDTVLQNNSIKDVEGNTSKIRRKTGVGFIIYCSKNNKIIGNYFHNISSYSLILAFSLKNGIHFNKFYGKPSLTYLHAIFLNSFLNNWNKNYWEGWKWRIPKPIMGACYFLFFAIPWINFDWQPIVS